MGYWLNFETTVARLAIATAAACFCSATFGQNKLPPPDLSRCEINEVFERIVASFPKKSDFESDAQFSKRYDEAVKTNLGADRLSGFYCEIAGLNGQSAIKYDANKGTITTNQNLWEGAILSITSHDEAPVVGETAFGVTRDYVRRYTIRHELKWHSVKLNDNPEFKMDPKTAEREFPDIGLTVYGKLLAPYATFDRSQTEATVDRPIEYNSLGKQVFFRPLSFVFWNKRAGSRFATLPVKACPDVGYHAAGACKQPEKLWFIR